MTIEKLPSGSYRIKQMLNGVVYSVTVKHKPTKAEAKELINNKMLGKDAVLPYSDTVCELANNFIIRCIQSNRSPSTVTNYKSIIRNTPTWFLDLKTSAVSQALIQKMIDEYASTHSAKSTYNLNGFYKGVFKGVLSYSTVTPKRTKHIEYEPTTQDIKRILEYSKGTRYECAINLAVIGLRRGEVCAITDKDLIGDVLTINKDMVVDDGLYIIKDSPKTTASNRRIKIPHDVAEMIRENGKAYSGFPNSINVFLHRAQDRLNIPRFRLHTLRHFAGAMLHKNGFTDKQVMAFMGWDDISTMHRVYNYNLDPEESQKDIADCFAKLKD